MSDTNVDKLNFEYWDIDKLIPYENNPRVNDHAVDKVTCAIKTFGFVVPMVIRPNGEIIDGHLRYKVAKQLGITTIPVVVRDVKEVEARALRLSINKVSDLAYNDPEKFKDELKFILDQGFDITPICLENEELAEIGVIDPVVDININPTTTQVPQQQSIAKSGGKKITCPKCGTEIELKLT